MASENLESEQRSAKPNVAELMAKIRTRLKDDVAAHSDKRVQFKPVKVDVDGQQAKRADEVVNSEELRNLNRMYTYSSRLNLDAISSHRGGIIGRSIVAVKRKVMRVLWESLLKDYLASEREFNTNLVRFLNDVSKYIGARDSAVFWELIRKIDYDVGKALERIERINDEQSASMRMLERRVLELVETSLSELRGGGLLDQHEAKIRTLDSVVRGLESIVSRLPLTAQVDKASQAAASSDSVTGNYSYLLLENRYRGSQEDVRRHLEIYPPIFSAATAPVLEIGAGRGELQSLFKQAGIRSYAVDMDPAMVATCLAAGLEAKLGDGIAHLESLADASLGGLIAVQVVEHLPRPILEKLFRLAASKVAPGGRVVFETINPRSLLALTSNYFRDPTHVWPLHPDTLEYAATLAGLKVKEIRLLSPVADGGKLQNVPVSEDMPPRLSFALQMLNRNIRQLNDWLYAPQDYCIIAEA
ncbi:MAG: class I SAM-dependent methyltransferase [Oligoflexia bacterium]|nr:class I SAM-dependent methyltransferase [Oligoflexia bacterium]